MSKPQNSYVNDPQITGACLEQGWNEGFAAGIAWAKEAAVAENLGGDRERCECESVIDWTEVDK